MYATLFSTVFIVFLREYGATTQHHKLYFYFMVMHNIVNGVLSITIYADKFG